MCVVLFLERGVGDGSWWGGGRISEEMSHSLFQK